MQEYRIIDIKKARAAKAEALYENIKATRGVDARIGVMEGKIPARDYKPGAYRKAIRKWHEEKGHQFVPCPSCGTSMRKDMADAQKKNGRKVECMKCIMGEASARRPKIKKAPSPYRGMVTAERLETFKRRMKEIRERRQQTP